MAREERYVGELLSDIDFNMLADNVDTVNYLGAMTIKECLEEIERSNKELDKLKHKNNKMYKFVEKLYIHPRRYRW